MICGPPSNSSRQIRSLDLGPRRMLEPSLACDKKWYIHCLILGGKSMRGNDNAPIDQCSQEGKPSKHTQSDITIMSTGNWKRQKQLIDCRHMSGCQIFSMSNFSSR